MLCLARRCIAAWRGIGADVDAPRDAVGSDIVSDTVKCGCPKCGAKYRLPVEYQGRSAKCKKCGDKFKIPAEKTVEDSVLDWLSEEPASSEDTTVERPRVVSISDAAPRDPSAAANSDSGSKPIVRRKASG